MSGKGKSLKSDVKQLFTLIIKYVVHYHYYSPFHADEATHDAFDYETWFARSTDILQRLGALSGPLIVAIKTGIFKKHENHPYHDALSCIQLYREIHCEKIPKELSKEPLLDAWSCEMIPADKFGDMRCIIFVNPDDKDAPHEKYYMNTKAANMLVMLHMYAHYMDYAYDNLKKVMPEMEVRPDTPFKDVWKRVVGDEAISIQPLEAWKNTKETNLFIKRVIGMRTDLRQLEKCTVKY